MIIAEIGSVHDGSFGNAKKLIELVAKCGADAVKFQTHIGKEESLKNAPNPGYFNSESRIEYFDRTSFNEIQWLELKKIAHENNLLFISSPFSLEAVDFLEKIGIDIYKIPSGEVSNIPLLEKISKVKSPIILSSGMSNWQEIDLAYETLKDHKDLTIMQCTSAYPCPNNQVGLNVIKEIKQRFSNVKIGFSDHTMGYSAPIAAAALGAEIIEKHFTFSRDMYGSDAKHSMEPKEFQILCKELKNTWEIIKNPVDKNDNSSFKKMKQIFEKSIVFSKNMKKGESVKLNDLKFKKPGTGIPAKDYKLIINKTLTKDINKDVLIKYSDIK